LNENAFRSEKARGSQYRSDVVRVFDSLKQEKNTSLEVRYFSKQLRLRQHRQGARLNTHTFMMLRRGYPRELIVRYNSVGHIPAVRPVKHVIKLLFILVRDKYALNVVLSRFEDC
jgi:hypothetical protein